MAPAMPNALREMPAFCGKIVLFGAIKMIKIMC